MLELMEHINSAPIHWKIWMNLLGVMNFGAIIFILKDIRARWVVLAMLGNLIFMSLLYKHFGYTRILGSFAGLSLEEAKCLCRSCLGHTLDVGRHDHQRALFADRLYRCYSVCFGR